MVQTQVVLVDLDNGDMGAKRDHLVQHLGAPMLEVASGGITDDGQPKRHLYWRLSEPAEDEDIARVCRTRHMIASKVCGDPSFRSAHQPIRVAGSVHAKNGLQRLVEIVACNERDYDLGELIEAIVDMPPLEGAAVDELDFNGTTEARGAVTELFARRIREGGVDGETRFETLARAMTIIETAKLSGLDPQAYLADVLDRIHDHKINRLDELLPWNRTPAAAAQAEAA